LRGRHRIFKYYLDHFHAPKGFFYAGAQQVRNFLTDPKYFDYRRLGTPGKVGLLTPWGQSSPWEGASHAVGQEIALPFMEPRGSFVLRRVRHMISLTD
jgi:hypothetical protein